jgi:hypothetical protein
MNQTALLLYTNPSDPDIKILYLASINNGNYYIHTELSLAEGRYAGIIQIPCDPLVEAEGGVIPIHDKNYQCISVVEQDSCYNQRKIAKKEIITRISMLLDSM